MTGVRFERPRSVKRALSLLASGEWTIIAGGTDLLVRIRDGVRPWGLLDITGLGVLRGIREREGHLWIGALTTHSEIEQNRKVRKLAPALAQAAGQIGSPAIRNRGTIGGNLVNASPAADTVPPLLALDAYVEITGPTGKRTIEVSELATGPGKTVVGKDELVTAVLVPLYNRRSVFVRLGTRKSLAITKVSVALAHRVAEDGRLEDVRIALGAVAPKVIRAYSAEQVLEGHHLDAARLEMACEAVKFDARPITDIRSTEEYRREMCSVLLKRALLSLNEVYDGA